MLTKQTILVIGTGAAAKAMAAHLVNANFHVLVSDKDYDSALAMADNIKSTTKNCDVEAMHCHFDSAWEADIIILTVNLGDQKEVAKIIKDVITQKILISINDEKLTSACSHFATLQQLLPNTKIVHLLTDGEDNIPAVFESSSNGLMIFGNDDEAVEIVSAMLEAANINFTKVADLSA